MNILYLFLALLLVPLIEIALFIKIGGLIGLWQTLIIVAFTAIIGSLLLCQQGFVVLRQFNETSTVFKNPFNTIVNALMILVAGIFLLTPCFFTDALGFSFLIPSIRQLIFQHIFLKFLKNHSYIYSTHSSASDNIIDAEFEEVDFPEHSPQAYRWKND